MAGDFTFGIGEEYFLVEAGTKLAVRSIARFGRSSERLDADQLQLALEEIEQEVARAEAEAERSAAPKTPRGKSRRQERKSLPAHLPRVEIVIEPEDTACRCCQGRAARQTWGGRHYGIRLLAASASARR